MGIKGLSAPGSYETAVRSTSSVEPVRDFGDQDKLPKGDLNQRNKDTSTEMDFQMLGNPNGQLNEDAIKQTISSINKKLSNTEFAYGVHESTNRIVIKVLDRDTKEVIRELPPEKTLELIAKAWELAGILIDEKL